MPLFLLILILILISSYNLPTPSRSRENTINIFDPNYKAPQYTPANNPQITAAAVNNFNNQYGYQLVPIYIPNEGYRYFVVIPVEKWNYLNTNHIGDDQHVLESQHKYDKYDKFNGKYNAKLKKYKAYEKFIKPTVQQQQVRISDKFLYLAWEWAIISSAGNWCNREITECERWHKFSRSKA